jgi:hypothetical protein
MGKNDKDLNPQEEKLYKDMLQAEIRKKLKEKIANNDPEIIKTIKVLLSSDKPKNNFE